MGSFEEDPGYRYLAMDKNAIQKELGDYDPKNVIWIEDEKDGYVMGDIAETTGDTYVVKTKDGGEKKIKKDDAQLVNPPKFLMIEDMANLTHLNDASVLENLRQRYYHQMIYVSSNLTVFEHFAKRAVWPYFCSSSSVLVVYTPY
ncbi:unnamed protein product [Calicophoron daubneyi]|uniref:Myosin N-terminal SH3-like domain-containing protein n=1 Tax=Calicophoron daubneyi TaxID=300641 RepID=A0AAV2THI4_CALDB